MWISTYNNCVNIKTMIQLKMEIKKIAPLYTSMRAITIASNTAQHLIDDIYSNRSINIYS